MSFNNNSLRFPPGFGHGRGHGQSGQAPELGGGIYAGWGSGQGRETIGGFPVGQGLQGPGGLRGLIAEGLEGGNQDASMRKYLGGGGGELARVGEGGLSRVADNMGGGYHGLGGDLGGGGSRGPQRPQQNVQQLLEEKRLLETNCMRLFDENKGLRFDNNEMIRRIRSQTEEGRRV